MEVIQQVTFRKLKIRWMKTAKWRNATTHTADDIESVPIVTGQPPSCHPKRTGPIRTTPHNDWKELKGREDEWDDTVLMIIYDQLVYVVYVPVFVLVLQLICYWLCEIYNVRAANLPLSIWNRFSKFNTAYFQPRITMLRYWIFCSDVLAIKIQRLSVAMWLATVRYPRMLNCNIATPRYNVLW